MALRTTSPGRAGAYRSECVLLGVRVVDIVLVLQGCAWEIRTTPSRFVRYRIRFERYQAFHVASNRGQHAISQHRRGVSVSCGCNGTSVHFAAQDNGAVVRSRCQLAKNRLSNNVGGVKHFLSTQQHALEEERHFALVEDVPIQPKPARNQCSGLDLQSDPCISSIATSTMILSSNSPVKEERDAPVNFSVFYCTPRRFSGCPACGPNLFTCS